MKYGIKKKMFIPIFKRTPQIVEAKREADKKEELFFEKYMQERTSYVSEK